MKIAVTQVKTLKKDLPGSIESHLKLIDLAVKCQAGAVFFPELSLTGYESSLAHEIVMDIDDQRLDVFQKRSDSDNIIIALGFPTRSKAGIRISMTVFEPHQAVKIYSKQLLHADELPYFGKGTEQLILKSGSFRMAPAICYESMRIEHLRNVLQIGADIYIACVADSEAGVQKAYPHYSAIAKEYAIPVLMSNSIGFCDNFYSVGKTAAWNQNGELLAALDESHEGLIVFDSDSCTVISHVWPA